jgi:hypothetical protein
MKDKYKMKNILRKLHLVENFKIELEVAETEFIKALESQVDKAQSGFFDLFSQSKNNYIGTVLPNSFELKKRKRFSDSNYNVAIAYGTFEQADNKLIINLEIKASNEDILNLGIYGLIGFTLLINCILLFSKWEGHLGLYTIPFILILDLFLLGWPYIIYRNSVKRMAFELKKRFAFNDKKIKTSYSTLSVMGNYKKSLEPY